MSCEMDTRRVPPYTEARRAQGVTRTLWVMLQRCTAADRRNLRPAIGDPTRIIISARAQKSRVTDNARVV